MKDVIKEINEKIRKVQTIGKAYKSLRGQGTKQIGYEYSGIITHDIPLLLNQIFPESKYTCSGSIGKGRISACAWVAIMEKSETKTTQNGIYIVFMFSPDLQKVYLSLGQGVTDIDESQLISLRDGYRDKLSLQSEYLLHQNDQLVDNPKYKSASIYSNEWKVNDDEYCAHLMSEMKKAYEKYLNNRMSNTDQQLLINTPTSNNNKSTKKNEQKIFTVDNVISIIKDTGLLYDDLLIKRFAFSLLTKPFVILSGLAGSGKTQLALVFAKALCEDIENQICFVPVGADWTNREPLLGYPNALRDNEYVLPESGVLQLMIEATKNPTKPYFLILDEMNLSYVERYFADFLSAMEAKDVKIKLWDTEDGEVPKSIALPRNIFVVGTINVDETTYMFSPKVLDRANVIEFKVSEEEMEQFLRQATDIDIMRAKSQAATMAEDFVKKSTAKISTETSEISSVLSDFFKQLKTVNAEFGYRSATEIARFITLATANNSLSLQDAIDAAIVQKLLPKLHGSRKKLNDTLQTLWLLCVEDGETTTLEQIYYSPTLTPKIRYKLSADKILRMYRTAIDNGFTSFAEA